MDVLGAGVVEEMQQAKTQKVAITALVTEESATKNFRITKEYHQQMAPTLKVRELLRDRHFSEWQIIEFPSQRSGDVSLSRQRNSRADTAADPAVKSQVAERTLN